MKPRIAIFAIVPIAILLLPLGVFAADGLASEGEIPRNVSVGGVPLGGLSYADATLVMEAHATRLSDEVLVVSVEGRKFQLDPRAVGFSVDAAGAVEAASLQRTDGGVVRRFLNWIGGFATPIDLPLPAAVDATALGEQLASWEQAAIPDPAFEGSVFVVDGAVEKQYPRDGRAIDRPTAAGIIEEALAAPDRPETALPVGTSNPELTEADVDAAAEAVGRVIDDQVTLRSSSTGFLITFSPEELAEAVRVDLAANPTRLVVGLDQGVIGALVEPRRAEFELPPVDAAYNVDLETDEVSVVPSRTGTVMDLPGVVASLLEAALGPGFGEFPVDTGTQPAFTTAQAESYGDLGLVSEFTTSHACCGPRVTNIQLMADTIDGAVVTPGGTFSVNDHVGQRTLEKGYLEDCAIIGGDILCEGHPANIGGGVSQFGTTFFNAVFFGCYEDIEHRPHSLYFNRYPEGREATLGYEHPDVVFRNNSPAPVILKTQHTPTSISVKFYGNNGGKVCTAETSERTGIVEPEEELVADDEGTFLPGQREKTRDGKRGFTVTVTRIIEMPDGTIVREEPVTTRYRSLNTQYTVHRCEVSGQPVNCPLKLPSVLGIPLSDAITTLGELGFNVLRGPDVEVEDPASDGIVLEMSPTPGGYVDFGSSVTLIVGRHDPGDGGGDGGGDGTGT